jgi:hypothetical protein
MTRFKRFRILMIMAAVSLAIVATPLLVVCQEPIWKGLLSQAPMPRPPSKEAQMHG